MTQLMQSSYCSLCGLWNTPDPSYQYTVSSAPLLKVHQTRELPYALICNKLIWSSTCKKALSHSPGDSQRTSIYPSKRGQASHLRRPFVLTITEAQSLAIRHLLSRSCFPMELPLLSDRRPLGETSKLERISILGPCSMCEGEFLKKEHDRGCTTRMTQA